jgi:tRNA threonylcarbamoyladenosine biosynthesis protein TsaE
MTAVLATKSVLETEEVGRHIGSRVRSGDIIALYGELGTGKTVIVKGLARSLGVNANIGSPSFTLAWEYEGRFTLYHIDLFRITSIDEILRIGYEEYLYGDGVCAIEWAEKMGRLLPAKRLDVRLFHVGPGERRIEVSPRQMDMPPLPEDLILGKGA